MRRIGEVLRLKAAGMNNSDIARSTGIGRTTVYEYLSRAQAAGLKWPLPVELDEAALEAKLFPAPTSELAAARPVPDWTAVHRELKRRRHVTLRLLWLLCRRRHNNHYADFAFMPTRGRRPIQTARFRSA